jgi:valyl-tRNA synthetase
MLYEFAWHEFADKYVELTKERRAEAQPTLEFVYINILKLLHPIMPFVTEELFRKCTDTNKSLMIEPWPSA